MPESIQDILDHIYSHIKKETELNAVNRTIGRGKVTIGSYDKQIWVTNRESKSTFRYFTDSNYSVHATGNPKAVDTYDKDGPVTNKNSVLGRTILHNSGGSFPYITPSGPQTLELENSATYFQNNGDAERIKVGLGEKGWVNFNSLQEALQKYAQGMDSLHTANAEKAKAEAEKKRLEEEQKRREAERIAELKRIKDEEEKKRIEELHRKEEEERQRKILEEELRIARFNREKRALEENLTNQLEEYAKAAGFIRRQATLRFNPVLDKVQDEVKFCNLFNGTTTIINGGPGTGKTTTMIQRLKLLISTNDLKEYIGIGQCSLNERQLNIITANGGNWIFFSPTELLKEYLKENMNYEGLQDTSNKVQVWTTYLAKILRDKYHIVGDNCPFSFKRKEHDNTILIKSQELELLTEYKFFFIDSIKKELARVAALDVSGYNWKIVGNSIIRACKDADKMSTLHDVLMLLMRLERYYDSKAIDGNKSIHDLIDSYYKEIQEKAINYLVEWKEDTAFYKSLLDIYQVDEFDEVVVEEDDDEEFNSGNNENKLLLDLRKIIRLLALREVDDVTFEGRKAELLNLVETKINKDEIKAFSSIAFLNKHIAPLIQNYELYLFPLIAKTYKAFRLQEYEKGNGERWNLTLLRRIVKTQDNRPLHPQEQSLILGIINNVILEIRKASLSRFESLSHKFGKAYKEVCCPVIGIDEATDYCLLDFYAINSLKHYEAAAITMTGDGMQCLKANGVFDWSALNDKRLFTSIEVKNLTVSYRQSKELLKLAHSLYRRTLHKIAPYKCYLEEMENLPKPLWYESEDEERKAKWIVQRVLEIKENYGFVPSIAVFVSNEEDAGQLVEIIQEQGKLDEAGIEVKNCIEGDKLAANDTVRVFPIDKVKGMEFEVVFFHNIHKLNLLLERYLYVGLSRATFYMGVTSDPIEEEDLLMQVQKMFNKRGNWKTLADEVIEESAHIVTEESPEEKVIRLKMSTENTVLTPEIINLAKTPRGGITKSQLEGAGLGWPRPDDWEEQLVGKVLTPTELRQFLTIKYATKEK